MGSSVVRPAQIGSSPPAPISTRDTYWHTVQNNKNSQCNLYKSYMLFTNYFKGYDTKDSIRRLNGLERAKKKG